MPTSWYHVIPDILNLIQQEQPKSLLNIGVGFGKYGLLIRDILELPFERYNKNQWTCIIDGVEAFRNYKNPIHDYIYNKIYYDNIIDVIDNLPIYDIILLIDVLEHFTKVEGKFLIQKLCEHINKSIIISTPLYPDKQKDYIGNVYEEHKSRWYITDFLDFDFSYKYIPIGNNGAQLINIFNKKSINYKSKQNINFNYYSRTIKEKNGDYIKIGYLLPHRNLTGGMKMLLENMKSMRNRGHKVYAFLKSNDNEDIVPNWYNNIEIDKKIVIPINDSFKRYVKDCDIVIAGWMSQLIELDGIDIPIIYWEQGNEWLFGDYNDLSRFSNIRNHLVKCFTNQVSVVSCSPTIAKILNTRFNKDSFIILNGIDTDFYYPEEKRTDEGINILMVGNPYLRFKGFDVALKGLQKVWEKGYKFNINWVCQAIPDVKDIEFPINIIKMPSQNDLAKIYRNSDILIFTSWYEGFGMPPLEAMASGVPVISTKCGGVESFIQPGVNGILIEPGDFDALSYSIIELIKNKKLRNLLSQRGRETALKLSIEKIAKIWEDFIYDVIDKY